MEKNLRAAAGGMVSFDDPKTGEMVYRRRKTEDGHLPGDRRVFEGRVDPPDPGSPTTVGDGEQDRDLSDMVSGLDGRRVRVTIEVLE